MVFGHVCAGCACLVLFSFWVVCVLFAFVVSFRVVRFLAMFVLIARALVPLFFCAYLPLSGACA